MRVNSLEINSPAFAGRRLRKAALAVGILASGTYSGCSHSESTTASRAAEGGKDCLKLSETPHQGDLCRTYIAENTVKSESAETRRNIAGGITALLATVGVVGLRKRKLSPQTLSPTESKRLNRAA